VLAAVPRRVGDGRGSSNDPVPPPALLLAGAYIKKERQAGRDPIFDLNGMMLQPPVPGPYAGARSSEGCLESFDSRLPSGSAIRTDRGANH
jgi:hypothetical protein